MGMQNAGFVVSDAATCVTLGSFNLLRTGWAEIMPFTFNTSYGIAFGMIAYVVISALTGSAKELRPASLAVTAMLLLTH